MLDETKLVRGGRGDGAPMTMEMNSLSSLDMLLFGISILYIFPCISVERPCEGDEHLVSQDLNNA